MDLAALVGGRDECSHERTQLRTSVRESPLSRKLANHRVGFEGRTRFSNESTSPSQQHEAHPGHQDSRNRGWRSRLSSHCCHGGSDIAMWLGKSDRSEQHLIWCCGAMSLVDYSSQLKRGKERVFQLVHIQRKRPRTSSRTRVSQNCCSNCVREVLTMHITDNHTKSL